jgi:hypothetical protein
MRPVVKVYMCITYRARENISRNQGVAEVVGSPSSYIIMFSLVYPRRQKPT